MEIAVEGPNRRLYDRGRLHFLEERSPLNRADRIVRPLLIGQGANDVRVKASESEQIVAAMRQHGIPVTYVYYRDEGHGLGRPENRRSFKAVVEAFLAAHFLWVPMAGHLSDRIGRKRMYAIGSVFVGVFGFIYFALLDTKEPALIFVAIALSLLPVMTCYGPQAAMIAESFTPRLRYSGSSLGYQLASIIAGGPSPFIATALFATFNSSFPIALYILLCGILGIVATSLLTDYTNKGHLGGIRPVYTSSRGRQLGFHPDGLGEVTPTRLASRETPLSLAARLH
jgi:MFS family permease